MSGWTYVVTGAAGQTGSAVCKALLDAGRSVRMVLRREDERAQRWRALGAQVSIASLTEPEQLKRAFDGAHVAYLMNPPAYFASDLFAAARHVHANLISAANAAGLQSAVALSSIGAQHESGTGNIRTTYDFEQQLQELNAQLTILRPGNFMQNWAWSLEPVQHSGVLPSMFRPLERQFPMVSAGDVGAVAAQLMLETPPSRRRIVELHGPREFSALDAAAEFSTALGSNIRAVEADPTAWASGMREHGFPAKTVDAFLELFEGFNSGHVCFEGTHENRHGDTSLREAIWGVVGRDAGT